jgi:hypothetical protein
VLAGLVKRIPSADGAEILSIEEEAQQPKQ